MAAKGILYLDVVVDAGDRRLPDAEILVRILRTEWKDDDVTFMEFSAGYNNRLVACMRSGDARDMSDVIVVRVYGPNTELMIDRDREIRCQRLFSAAGCAPALICRFKNGFAYGYAHGRMFDLELAYEPKVMRILTKELAKVHSVNSENIHANEGERGGGERGGGGGGGRGGERRGGGRGVLETGPQLFKDIDKFLRIVSQEFEEHEKLSKFNKMGVGHDDLEKEVEYLRSVLPSLHSPVVLCHNDLLFNNILHDQQTNKITFIDFEFASFNYQAFDIATHFCEYAGMDTVDYSKYPDRSHQYAWLRCYLEAYLELIGADGGGGKKEEISEEEVERLRSQVDWFTLGSHMFWALWALVQSKYSVIDYDYLEYSSIRFKEYFRKKKTLLEESRAVDAIQQSEVNGEHKAAPNIESMDVDPVY